MNITKCVIAYIGDITRDLIQWVLPTNSITFKIFDFIRAHDKIHFKWQDMLITNKKIIIEEWWPFLLRSAKFWNSPHCIFKVIYFRRGQNKDNQRIDGCIASMTTIIGAQPKFDWDLKISTLKNVHEISMICINVIFWLFWNVHAYV